MANEQYIRMSFTAGELHPLLIGRHDVDAVLRGAQYMNNFLVSPFGGIQRREGLQMINHLPDLVGGIRLLSFQFSSGDQFVLELTRGRIRYYQGGELVYLNDTPLSTLTPWTTDETLQSLRMQQLNDVIFFVCPQVPPMALSRHSNTHWVLAQHKFSAIPYYSMLDSNVKIRLTPAIEASTYGLRVLDGTSVFVPHMVGIEQLRVSVTQDEQIFHAKPATEPPSYTSINRTITLGEQFCYTAGEWKTAYTCIERFEPAYYQSSSPSPEDYPTFFTRGIDATPALLVEDAWSLQTFDTWDADWEISRATEFLGLHATTAAPQFNWSTFKSFSQNSTSRQNYSFTGIEDEIVAYLKIKLIRWKTFATTGTPQFRLAAYTCHHPFLVNTYSSPTFVQVISLKPYNHRAINRIAETTAWSLGAFGITHGYPAGIEFYQNRLWLAGTPGQPQTVWASAVDDYADFGVKASPSSAMSLTIAASQQNLIAWIAALRGLIVGTSEEEWRLKASDENGLNLNNASFEKQSSVGSSPIDILPVDHGLFFVQKSGTKVREIAYSIENDGFIARDSSILSEHLLTSGIRAWAQQNSTASHLWCILNDGTAACLTINKEQNISAWHAHRPTHGRFTSVTAIQASTHWEDEVWFTREYEWAGTRHVTIERLGHSGVFLDSWCPVASPQDTPAHLLGLPTQSISSPWQAGQSIIGTPYASVITTMPFESAESIGSTGAIKGQFITQLLVQTQSLDFQFGTADFRSYQEFEPGRYNLSAPYSGYIKLTHNHGYATQPQFSLSTSATSPFDLLGIVAWVVR